MEKKKHELFFEIGTEYEMRVALGMGEGRGLTFYSNRVDVWDASMEVVESLSQEQPLIVCVYYH